MRRLVLYLLILGVVVFYAGSAGAAAAPYYETFSGFIHNVTSVEPTTHAPASSPSPSASKAAAAPAATPTAGAATHNVTSGPPPTATAGAQPTSAPTATHPAPHTKGTAAKSKALATLTPQQRAAEIQHLVKSSKVPQGRINFLLLGSDNDQKFADYANPLTQVVIVASLDTTTHKITLLSISRDLWVHIPGYKYNVGPDGSVGWSKIDVASKLGFDSAACTVENDFGIYINNWIWVGLKGFTKVIDDLHGATLDVPYPVIDNTYPDDLSGNPYAYRRIYIPPGPQHLNGDQALHFVRSRHGDASGDFGRSSRQQILLNQLRRSFAGKNSGDLFALVPQLLKDFGGDLKTDANVDLTTASQYLALFQALKHSKPTEVVLSPPYSSDEYVYDHDPDVEAQNGGYPVQEDALAPNWPLIDAKIRQLLGGQQQITNHYCAREGVTP